MEVKIKSMKYEDFKDNEYIEHLVDELKASHTNVVVGCLDELINWGRSNSLWPLTFATSCCGIEFMSLGAARYDMARFGFEVAPCQSASGRFCDGGRVRLYIVWLPFLNVCMTSWPNRNTW